MRICNLSPVCVCHSWEDLYGDGDDGGQLPNRWRVVLLHSHEPPQDVVSVTGPGVHMCVLEPVRDVTLFRPGEHDGNEPEILASILNELVLELFVNVDGVERPLIVLHTDRWGRHCLIVLWTDDDDDQIFFLTEISLHEVNFADAPELLLKDINMRVEAVVSQQSNKVDDLVDVLVVVCFICDKDPSLLQRERCTAWWLFLCSRRFVTNMCVTGSR